MSLTLINQSAIRETDLDGFNVVQGAKITVRNSENNNIATIYNSDNPADAKPNPFFADDVGQIEFFIDSGLYTIYAMSVTDTKQIEGKARIQVKNDFSNGSISNYLNDDNSNFSSALALCCLENEVVLLEGLTLSTDDTVVISKNSKCRRIELQGANIKFSSGSIEFKNKMSLIDLGGGTINLGLKLAKIAVNGSKDATSLIVNRLNDDGDYHGFKIGDYMASSLDNDYLPNSTSRVGYIENGDYNRISNIVDNLNGTDTVTLTYPFLRSADPLVDTGLIQNAWVGNPSFQVRGIVFAGNAEGSVEIINGTIENPRGYYVDLDNGAGDLRKATLYLDITVRNTFIDMVRARCRGVEFGSNYNATRQYDFSKQHLVGNIPNDTGYVMYRSGCRISRQNRDGEIFITQFETGEDITCGKITVEPGCYFDGSQPEDLPTSDFSPGGQVYWGKLVAIGDALHFVVPNAANPIFGGIYFSGEAVGYARSIYGTSFAGKDSFISGRMVFNGAKLSCEPAYIEINGGTTAQYRASNFIVTTNNCYIESRGLNNYDGGCVHFDNGSVNILTIENRDSPQINGAQSWNFINKTGGLINGRYSVAGSDSSFNSVGVAYQGSADATNGLVFRNGSIGNPGGNHLVLHPPLIDDNFEGSGLSFGEYNQILPIEAWFSSNATNQSAIPPFINFKFINFEQSYKYGSTDGFSKRYRALVSSPRNDLGPVPTRGKWSGIMSGGDEIYIDATRETEFVDSSEQTVLSSDANQGDLTVTVNTPPTVDVPRYIGIFSRQFGTYFYYRVTSVSGNVIGIGAGYSSTAGIFPLIGSFSGEEVTFLHMRSDPSEGLKVYSGQVSATGIGLVMPSGWSVGSPSTGVYIISHPGLSTIMNPKTTSYDTDAFVTQSRFGDTTINTVDESTGVLVGSEFTFFAQER